MQRPANMSRAEALKPTLNLLWSEPLIKRCIKAMDNFLVVLLVVTPPTLIIRVSQPRRATG